MAELENQPLSPEQQLVEDFMNISRTAYVKLEELLYRDTADIGRKDLEQSKSAENLRIALGEFVLANIDNIDSIHELNPSDEVNEALGEFTATAIANMLDTVSYEQYEKKHDVEVETLLQGRLITARPLKGSIAIASGGILTSGASSPEEVTGTFYSYDSGLGNIWIADFTGQPRYQVSVWGMDYGNEGVVEQWAEITVHPEDTLV